MLIERLAASNCKNVLAEQCCIKLGTLFLDNFENLLGEFWRRRMRICNDKMNPSVFDFFMGRPNIGSAVVWAAEDSPQSSAGHSCLPKARLAGIFYEETVPLQAWSHVSIVIPGKCLLIYSAENRVAGEPVEWDWDGLVSPLAPPTSPTARHMHPSPLRYNRGPTRTGS